MAEREQVPASIQRFDGVDALRGLSILAVVLHHTYLSFFFAHVRMDQGLSGWWKHLLFFNGQNAVTMFFAVSGFLITATSLRRFGSLAAMRPQLFYRIRFARIAPLLLAVLAVLSALHLLHIQGFVVKTVTLPRALFSALTFHLNWLEARYGWLPANWDVLWSLSVEEMFYLFFPLICLALLRWKHGLPAFLLVLLAFVAMGPLARTVWATTEIWQEKTYLGGMDAIALGCLTALLVDRARIRSRYARWPVSLQFFGAGMIALILAWPTWSWYRPMGHLLDSTSLYATVLPLGTCCVIAGTVLRGREGSPWTAPVRWFGRHSYEIYMTHEFLVILGTNLMLRAHHGSPWLWAAATMASTVPVGWAIAQWLSEPANRALRAARPPKSPKPVAVAA